MPAPSYPTNVLIEYVTDASGSQSIIALITEASGSAAVTNYQFGGPPLVGYTTADNILYTNLAETTTAGKFLLSNDARISANIMGSDGQLNARSVNSYGTKTYGKLYFPKSSPTLASTKPASSSIILTYSAASDQNRTGFAYKINNNAWVHITSATTYTITGLTNGSTYTVILASYYSANPTFPYESYRYTNSTTQSVLVTPVNTAPVISNIAKTTSGIGFTVTTSVASGTQPPLGYKLYVNGTYILTVNV